MRIAFVGKGGSGKTTAAAAFSRRLAAQGCRVVAVDADINRGSRLVDLGAEDVVLRRFAIDTSDGVRLLVAGAFAARDVGVACYHAKTGAVELYLNHLVDGPGEYVVVDMTAGADAFASGLFTRFDLTVLVSEPTRRGVGVFRQYAELAAGHGVALAVLGNKIADDADVAWLRGQVGDALLGCLTASAWVRAAERGAPAPFAELEQANHAVLADIRSALDARERDWAAYHRTTVAMHRANSAAWAGADRIAQIDPDFVPA